MRLLIKSVINKTESIINTGYGIRNFHTTNLLLLDQKWRRENKLHMNPTSFGPLTNLPDYSFTDGRPVPLGSKQKQRMVKQQQLATKIVTMCEELDFAKENHKKRIALKEESKNTKSPLKPKGHLLFQK